MLKVTRAKNASGPTEILLYDTIGEDPFFGGGVSSKAFAAALRDAKKGPIDLRINSGGGSVFEGAAIYDLIRQHPAPVNVYVDGIAASIASLIAMAGTSIEMGEASWLMIHKAWTFTIGNANDMTKTAADLEKIDGVLIDAYERKTGKDRAELADMLAAETWFTGQEAVAAGFADTVFKQAKVAAWANFDRFGYTHVPEPVKKGAPDTDTRAALAAMSMAMGRRGLTPPRV
jgi:ATP-dependent protease ClpP protease subunit